MMHCTTLAILAAAKGIGIGIGWYGMVIQLSAFN